MLHAHNPGEVLAACGGIGALALLCRLRGEPGPGGLKVSRLALSALLLIGAMHGTRWPIEAEIHDLVALIRARVPECAYAGSPTNLLTQK
jgi:hypothetical protein